MDKEGCVDEEKEGDGKLWIIRGWADKEMEDKSMATYI